MELLQKKWIRAIIGLLGGGLLIEIIHINTGNPNRPRENNSLLLLLFAVVIYLLLTYILKKTGKIK